MPAEEIPRRILTFPNPFAILKRVNKKHSGGGLYKWTGAVEVRVPVDIERIYGLYGASMYRYLSLKLCSETDAEDVLQAVLCRLIRYPLKMRLVRNPRAYVFRLARNEANRFLRSSLRSKNAAGMAAQAAAVIEKMISGPDQGSTRRISEALAKIPAEQREVITLKFFEGLTFREIGGVRGESQNTAASRYRYGLEKLRQLMEKNE